MTKYILIIGIFLIGCRSKTKETDIDFIHYDYNHLQWRIPSIVFIKKGRKSSYLETLKSSVELAIIEVDPEVIDEFYSSANTLDVSYNGPMHSGHEIKIIRGDSISEWRHIKSYGEFTAFFNLVLPRIIKHNQDSYIADIMSVNILHLMDAFESKQKSDKTTNVFVRFQSLTGSVDGVYQNHIRTNKTPYVNLCNYEIISMIQKEDLVVKEFNSNDLSIFRKINGKYDLIAQECPGVFKSCNN